MVGEDGDGLGDGRRPNELGMVRQAEVFTNILKPILLKQPSVTTFIEKANSGHP